MKRIAIIHPDGNILNNPNLSGIVEILCEHGYLVDIYSPPMQFYQNAPCEGSRLILQEFFPLEGFYAKIVAKFGKTKGLRRISKFLNNRFTKKIFYKNIPADIVIGVDRWGIIEASKIAKSKKIPYGFISYEIIFEKETSCEFKKIERDACKGISFALCQDLLRSEHLSMENKISQDKIINIPVAGRSINRDKKNFYLHDKLGINRDKHIVLYMGSIASWSSISFIIECAKNWAKDFVLVIHPRFGIDEMIRVLLNTHKNSSNIYFSLDPVPNQKGLSKIVKSADYGIAFYNPDYNSIYTGNNLKFLGMSSGKIATYLQHGIPVIINEVGIISEYVKRYNLGVVTEKPTVLTLTEEYDAYSERCYKFYQEYFDLNIKIEPLIKNICELLSN